jgi:Pyruvate/2-oxoacid:ferredoxin oxidoreductase delta subunit
MTLPPRSRRDFLFGRFLRAESPVSPSPATPAEPRRAAVILDHLCLAYLGTFCSVCVERCPEAGAIAVEKGRPTVVADRCTGCGICVDVCPAPGGGAIAAMPAASTPMRGRRRTR